MKKILCGVLAVCTLSTAVLGAVGCGDSGYVPTNRKVTAAEWAAEFEEVDNFQFRLYYPDYSDEARGPYRRSDELLYSGGRYATIESVTENGVWLGNVETIYGAEEKNGETTYYKMAEQEEYEKVAIEETEFLYDEEFFMQFVDCLTDKFSSAVHTEGGDAKIKYLLDATGAEFDGVEQVIAVMSGKQFELAEIQVEFLDCELREVYFKSYVGLSEGGAFGLPLENVQLDLEFENGYFKYDVENIFDTLDNFTLIGGKGTDYGEYYFTENEFRLYTPKMPDPTQREAFWQKVGEGETAKYVYYTQNESGAWQKNDQMTENQYLNARGGIAELLFTCLREKAGEAYAFTYENGVYKGHYFSFDNGLATYTFTEVKIVCDENNKIVSATYKLRIEQGTVEPVTYSYTLTAGNTQITIPTV